MRMRGVWWCRRGRNAYVRKCTAHSDGMLRISDTGGRIRLRHTKDGRAV